MSTVEAEPVMPVSDEAERAILGAVLLDNGKFYEADEHLRGDEFALDSHGKVYAAIGELMNRGGQADMVTLSEHLRVKGQLEAIGGIPYLSGLTNGVVLRTSILHYVKIVRDKFLSRRLIEVSDRTRLRALEQSEPVDEQFEDLQQSLVEMVQRGGETHVNLKDAGREWFAQMEEQRRLEPGKVVGVPTPLAEFDELTTGFRKNEVVIIAAKAGGGKTAFMCQGVRRQVQCGYKPGLFSIEVPRDQIITRLACQETGISVFDARDNRQLDQFKYEKLVQAGADITMQWDFLLEDRRMTPKRLGAIARSWVAKGCDCVWVDHLLLLASRAPGKTEYERVTHTMEYLWDLARFVGVPVVVLHHMTRGAGVDSEPTMEELRASGEIENRAHLVGLLHRPVTVDDEGQRYYTGEDKLIIGKQRSGPALVHIPVKFNAVVGVFEPRQRFR